jgi:beta-glucosidase
MSDWGAVHGVEDALKGLDQQSGEQIDAAVYFGEPLAKAAASDPVYAARVTDMNRRILRRSTGSTLRHRRSEDRLPGAR